jgi:DNA (cytosine-5)-methyltransferase 1
MKYYNCASFFAGVGGIDLAFEKQGFKTIYANEIDENAAKTYQNNFNIKVDVRDIKNVLPDEIPSFDILLAGFPCQAFSLAGYRKGFEDEKGRGTLFFEIERILKSKKPDIVFLENVKNLVGHDNGNTFRIILEKLNNTGYYVKYQVLNGMTFGNVPQNRERIYIVGFRKKSQYLKFEFPTPIPLNKKISDIVDFNNKKDERYYYNQKNCSFYNNLKKDMVKKDTVYQWRRIYVRENKSNVCPTLTANMGTGGHNVPLVLTKYGIRKLTPQECFAFQGFESSFKIPKEISNTSAYKQAGNSVVVSVIERIAEQIKKVL